MKLTRVFAVVAAAVLLQVAFARFAIGGRFTFDFVLVGVVFAAVGEGLEVDAGEVGGFAFVLGEVGAVFGVVFPSRLVRRG